MLSINRIFFLVTSMSLQWLMCSQIFSAKVYCTVNILQEVVHASPVDPLQSEIHVVKSCEDKVLKQRGKNT